jgi:hypothetical protein
MGGLLHAISVDEDEAAAREASDINRALRTAGGLYHLFAPSRLIFYVPSKPHY